MPVDRVILTGDRSSRFVHDDSQRPSEFFRELFVVRSLHNIPVLGPSVTRDSFHATERIKDQHVCDWLEITKSIRNGDSDAFAQFYALTFDVMFVQVRRAVNCDEQTALDLVQSAMLKSIRSMKPLPDENAVSAWAAVVAKSTAYDWLRKKARRREVEINHANAKLIASSADKREVAADLAARLRWLELELQAFPADLQQMISFRYRFGWSLRRIAEAFGIKTGAVDGRIRRALESLRSKATHEYHE